MPTTDAASADTGSTRRRLLGAGLAGSVLGVLGARQVSASGGSSTTTTEPASDTTAPATTQAATTTTIAAPRQPTPTDVELLAFIITLELAATEMYGEAAAVEGLDEQAAVLYGVLAEHHRAYANNIAGRLGKAANNVPNAPLVDEFGSGLTGPDATEQARELEEALIATHLDALGRLEGVDAAELIASIVVVEGQHVAALAALAGLDADSDYDVYVSNTADALTPDDYPASA